MRDDDCRNELAALCAVVDELAEMIAGLLPAEENYIRALRARLDDIGTVSFAAAPGREPA